MFKSVQKIVIFQATGCAQEYELACVHVIWLAFNPHVVSALQFGSVTNSTISNTLGLRRQAAYHFKRHKRGSFTWLPFTFTILLRFFLLILFMLLFPFASASIAAAAAVPAFFRRIFYPIQIINYVFVYALVLRLHSC